MQDTDPCGVSHSIRATNGVKFLQQGCNVILRRVCRNAELAGNQLVGRTLCQQRKHLQFSSRAASVGLRLGRRPERGDDKHVRFIVFTDQLKPFNLGQDGRNPISESGVSHVDRQP